MFVGLDLFGLARELVLITLEGLAGLLGGLTGDIGNLDHARGHDEIDIRIDVDFLTVTGLGLDDHALLHIWRILGDMGAGLQLRVVDDLPRLFLGLAGDIGDLHRLGAGGDDQLDHAVLLHALTAGRIGLDGLALVDLCAVLLVAVDSQALLDERGLGLVGVHIGHIRDLDLNDLGGFVDLVHPQRHGGQGEEDEDRTNPDPGARTLLRLPLLLVGHDRRDGAGLRSRLGLCGMSHRSGHGRGHHRVRLRGLDVVLEAHGATVAGGEHVLTEGVGVLVAGVAVLEQSVEEEPVDGRWDALVKEARRLRSLTDVLIGHCQLGVADERGTAGQKLIEQAGGGIEVGTGVDDLTARLFGGEVLGGADHRLGLRQSRVVLECSGDPEVHDLDVTLGGEHDVRRLDVAVDDAVAMGVLERSEDSGDDVEGLVDGECAVFIEDFAQRLTLDVFHDDEGHGHGRATGFDEFLFTRIVDGDDSGVIETGRGLRLALEAGVERGIAGEIGAQKFDGHATPETVVDALMHFCHAPTAEERTNFVTPRQHLGFTHVCPPLVSPGLTGSFSPEPSRVPVSQTLRFF